MALPSQRKRFAFVLLFGVALLLGAMLAAIFFGEVPINLSKALDASLPYNPDRLMLFSVRLPRVVMGALCGVALSVVGASLQAH